jgi:hypothetical protein
VGDLLLAGDVFDLALEPIELRGRDLHLLRQLRNLVRKRHAGYVQQRYGLAH